MSDSPILPAAHQVVSAVLTSLSYHKTITPDDLRQRGNWLYGAKMLASVLNDQDAADLLHQVDMHLLDLAASPGTDADISAELGKLMMRINGQGQEARP